MLIPLAVLSLGALAAGYVFKEAFIGHDYEHFWKAALFTGKDNHILHAMHEVSKWVVWSPFVAMVIGFVLALANFLVLVILGRLKPDGDNKPGGAEG